MGTFGSASLVNALTTRINLQSRKAFGNPRNSIIAREVTIRETHPNRKRNIARPNFDWP
jgi:hypothetical protein